MGLWIGHDDLHVLLLVLNGEVDRPAQALVGRDVKKLPTLRGRTVVNLFFKGLHAYSGLS